LLAGDFFAVRAACATTGLVPNTAAKVFKALCAEGMLKELTGQKRNRLYGYSNYLKVLSEGTEALR